MGGHQDRRCWPEPPATPHAHLLIAGPWSLWFHNDDVGRICSQQQWGEEGTGERPGRRGNVEGGERTYIRVFLHAHSFEKLSHHVSRWRNVSTLFSPRCMMGTSQGRDVQFESVALVINLRRDFHAERSGLCPAPSLSERRKVPEMATAWCSSYGAKGRMCRDRRCSYRNTI